MEAANPSFISSSYWTDGVGPAAALACVDKMRRLNAQTRVWELGGKMQLGLAQLAERYPTLKMKSWGLPSNPYMTFDLGGDASHVKVLIVRKMLKHGFLSTGGASYVMFSHNEEMICRYLEALDRVLAEISDLAGAGRLAAEAGSEKVLGQFARLT